MRRNLLVPFFAIAILYCMYLPFNTQSVQAQKTSAKKKIARQTWEYCAITSSTFTRTNDVVDGGFATVFYFDTSGFRQEIIKLPSEKIDEKMPDKHQYMKQKAWAAAIAQLGDQGWEIVGQLPFNSSFLQDMDHSQALFFKRVKL